MKTPPECQVKTAQIRQDLLTVFNAAVSAVNGANCVADYLSRHPLSESKKISLLSIGKAAESMALGVVAILGDRIRNGLIITKTGHLTNQLDQRFTCLESSHPVPDLQSLFAGKKLQSFCAKIEPGNELIVCISGGASSLVEVLRPEIDLEQLQFLNHEVLATGQNIYEINQKRQQLSKIKAGGLAKLLIGHKVLALYLSDVKGDDTATIGSGLLDSGNQVDRHPEITHAIVANIEMAKNAANAKARQLDYATCVHQQFFTTEAATIAKDFVNTAIKYKKILHIWGGESVVRLPQNPGKGGRNQHLALAALIKIAQHKQVTLLAAGTDGNDGTTDVAGAIVDSDTLYKTRIQNLNPEKYLQQANANAFFQATGDLVKTGPTNTNVMDLVLAYCR